MDNDEMLDKLRTKIEDMNERVATLESANPLMLDLLKRNIESNEKLGETLHSVEISITGMNGKIDDQARALDQLRQDMDRVGKESKNDIDKIKGRVKSIESKNSFDILSFLKTKLPWIILGIGALAALLSPFFKF